MRSAEPRPERLQSVADRLNQQCFCITVDRARLQQGLGSEIGDAHPIAELLSARPHLFSATPVFLTTTEVSEMLRIVRAIEAVAALPEYRETVLAWAPDIARYDPGSPGAFMGYDFHLTDDGPKLIEVNTNAGGAILNARLLSAQSACCTEVDVALRRAGAEAFEAAVVAMFESEWRAQGHVGRPRRIAIVDDQPQEQYLYPEFLLAQRLLERHGFETCLADVSQLHYDAGRLLLNGAPIDLVYNRLVDFGFQETAHEALRKAYLDAAAVVTPHPRAHALFADKRNLTVLADNDLLRSWKVSDEALCALRGIPRAVHLTTENAPHLWQTRKDWFFKPAAGYGSKAVYRGDKITKGVWADIVRRGYIAQQFAAPGERMVRIDGEPQARKVDVRLYIYNGELLLSAARIYQGQTTNFRTPGGGFAPLLAL